jgi:capsular exopolysaccharide synthesis family protein
LDQNAVPIRREEQDLWTPEERPEGPPRDGGEQVWNFIGLLVRRWKIVVSIAAVVFALSFGSGALAPKIYRSTALILINAAREEVITDQELVTRSNASDDAIESELEVMRSPEVLERVVDDLRLTDDARWLDVLPRPSGLSSLAALLNGGGSIRERARAENLTPDEKASLRRGIAARLYDAIRVRRRTPSFVIEITAIAATPRAAADLANATAGAYLEEQRQSQVEATERARTFLRGRANELAAEVQAKETAAEQFRVAHRLPAVASAEAPADVQTMLAQARADLTEKQARLRQVEALIAQGGSADLIAGAANSALITELRSRESEMQRRQVELEQRYGPLHPDVQSGEVELTNLRERIQGEISRITTGLRNEVEIARRRLASLQQNYGSDTQTLDADNNEDLIRYRQLLREADAARTVHQSFLQRVQEVESQSALPVTSARLLTAAPQGGPAGASLIGIIRTALLMAIAAGVAAAFLVELLDRTISSAAEAERKTGRRAVASVPKITGQRYRTLSPQHRHPAGYLVEKPMSDVAEAFRVLRTSLTHARIDKKIQVVAITSALAGEGKTTVALCLARVSAMSGQRVVIIDCDLRRQSLANLMGLESKGGLLNVLREEMGWQQALQQDEETSLQVLAGSPTSFTPLDLFSSRAMGQLLVELKGSFDLVVLDCAPVLHVADTRTAAANADLTLVVVRADKTPSTAVRSALRELHSTGSDIHGLALNCVTAADTRLDYYGALHYNKNDYYAS